jgi:acyl transferase domain-containing protein
VGYVEAHGTGTELGDPIEVEALREAFGDGGGGGGRREWCALSAVKSNVGHLDTAAGVAGLIKAVLALEHGEIPPVAGFERPNPAIDFASSPFYVAAERVRWKADGAPRRAGVSSFGIGGTNAHLVLEEAPAAEAAADEAALPARPAELLVVSARSRAALDAASRRLAAHLEKDPEQELGDAAWTLAAGRRELGERRVVVAADREAAIRALGGEGAGAEPGGVTAGLSGPGSEPAPTVGGAAATVLTGTAPADVSTTMVFDDTLRPTT